MSFTDHKITQFTHRIVDLPDQPNLPADELKARFDSSPEELRESLNAVCDDADRLDDRVSGIIAETFGDTISKSMLSDELAAELDGKADQAEMEQTMLKRSDLYFGYYTGDGTYPRDITLGFQPIAVFIKHASGIAATQTYCNSYFAIAGGVPNAFRNCIITENGFQLSNVDSGRNQLNAAGASFVYLAVK